MKLKFDMCSVVVIRVEGAATQLAPLLRHRRCRLWRPGRESFPSSGSGASMPLRRALRDYP